LRHSAVALSSAFTSAQEKKKRVPSPQKEKEKENRTALNPINKSLQSLISLHKNGIYHCLLLAVSLFFYIFSWQIL